MKKVLVLCTGNSCRSQMAEGFLNQLGVDVCSAGIESHGLNPVAVQVMQEINIDISQNNSKKINDFNLDLFDILITVCDHAREICPNVSEIETKIHNSFTDPTTALGSDTTKLNIYRSVRDEIQIFCNDFYAQYFSVK